MIKLIVFDLDNTLAEHGKGIEASDIKKIKELEEMEIKIVLLIKKENRLSLHKDHARTLPKVNVSQQDN